jgi:hypothetical protein
VARSSRGIDPHLIAIDGKAGIHAGLFVFGFDRKNRDNPSNFPILLTV